MLPVSEANILSRKKTDFGVTAAIKQKRRLCNILRGEDLVAVGGMQLCRYNADYGGSGERGRRKS